MYNINLPFYTAMNILIDLCQLDTMENQQEKFAEAIIDSFDTIHHLRNSIIEYFGSYDQYLQCPQAEKLRKLFGNAIINSLGE